MHALPQHWKENIKQFARNLINLHIQDHHLIKCTTIQNLEKLNSRELETKIRIFQYKLLNDVPYLNKKLFHFGIISQSKCSFCELYDEFPQHIFYENLWNQFQLYLSEKVALLVLNPQGAICVFTDVLVNHLLLIFKYNIYNSRVNNTLSFENLKCVISQIKHIEETMSENDLNKIISNNWKLIDHLFQSSLILIIIIVIIIIVIIIIYSCYYYYYYYFYNKSYLEKEKATEWEGGFTNSMYMFTCMLSLY